MAYAADFDIEAHLCLVEGKARLQNLHPSGAHKLLREARSTWPLLSALAIVESPDADAAKAVAAEHSETFSTFATSSRFRIRSIVQAFNWGEVEAG